MLLRTLWRAASAASALAPVVAAADDPSGQSTFVSPDGNVAFAFTVPDNNNADVLFSMRAPVSNAWVAVGLGSDDMKGALFLIIYRNERGDNVTFSPRLAYGNYEPAYFADVKYQVLDGTGIDGDHMVFKAKCSDHCRSWPAADSNSGYIDVSSPNQKAIYALGPRERFHSDDPAAPLKFHREYGVFTIDMKRTQGAPDPPVLDKDSKSVGTSLDYRTTGKSDYKSALHAAFMIIFLVVMIPLGAVLLRLGRWARWHGLNQSVAMVGVLAGLAMGVLTSFNYQRSRAFTSHHQILGFIIVGFILGQFSLGLLHHQQYRKTQAPTKFARIHLWLGRVIIFLGFLNAFFGFVFAQNRKFSMLLAGIIILGSFGILFATVGRQWFSKKKRFQPIGGPLSGAPTGYQPQPWHDDHDAAWSADAPPGYEAPSQQISLQPVSSSPTPWKSPGDKDYEDEPALGSSQRPREFA